MSFIAPPGNILLLCSQPARAAQIVASLQACSHKVTAVATEAALVQAAMLVDVDLVILDTTVVADAGACAGRLHATERLSDVPLLGLVPGVQAQPLGPVLEAGMDDVLVFPDEGELLPSRAGHLVALRQMNRALSRLLQQRLSGGMPPSQSSMQLAAVMPRPARGAVSPQHEEQERQAQKMEAIGRLAGGVAHDFNNLLMIIDGNLELALVNPDLEARVRKNIEEARKATDRAVDLTSQLLAFSRKQVVQPRVIDLNVAVSEIGSLLRRVIDESIELTIVPCADPARIKADATQIEQAVLNLAINARDAMPKGGKLIIETSRVQLDEAYTHAHLGVTPGEYVQLSVTDTGTGMDENTRARIFEPFFTTKGRGKGTGLGLATVYGIVNQNHGHIWVYSELDRGSTFKIYLPCVDEPVFVARPPSSPSLPATGSETILLVEDEPSVRELIRETLLCLGYKVLEAGNGEEALKVSADYQGTIDLLVTDMVMPRMGGPELSQILQVQRQGLKVIYMSGYTEHAVLKSGILDQNAVFMPKPFNLSILISKIRELLNAQVQLN